MNQTLETDIEVLVREVTNLSESVFMQVWDNPEDAVYDDLWTRWRGSRWKQLEACYDQYKYTLIKSVDKLPVNLYTRGSYH